MTNMGERNAAPNQVRPFERTRFVLLERPVSKAEESESTRRAENRGESQQVVGVDKAFSTTMIALVPSRATRAALSAVSDLPVEQLHCTVVFLGETSGITSAELAAISAKVKQLAGAMPETSVSIESVDLLGPPDEQVQVAKLDHPPLVEMFYEELMKDETIATVYARNVEVKWPEYIPHVTLGSATMTINMYDMPGTLFFDKLALFVSGVVLEESLIRIGPSLDSERADVAKYNRNHGARGRFVGNGGEGGGSVSVLDQRTKRIQAAGSSYVEELNMMGHLGRSEGFTLDPVSQRSSRKGFSVAIDEHRSLHVNAGTLTSDKLAKWQIKNAKVLAAKTVKIGGWFDKEDGTVWIDVVHVLPHKADAIKLAQTHNQKAIFDLSTKTTINTGGTGLAKSSNARLFAADTSTQDIVDWANSFAVAKINTHHDKLGMFAAGGGATHPNTHYITVHHAVDTHGTTITTVALKEHAPPRRTEHHSVHTNMASAQRAINGLADSGYKTAGRFMPPAEPKAITHGTKPSKGTAKERQHQVNNLTDAQKVEYEKAPSHYNHDQAMTHAIVHASIKSRRRDKQIKKYGVVVPTARAEYVQPRFTLLRKFNPHHRGSGAGGGEFTSGSAGGGVRGSTREGTGSAYAGGGGGSSLPPIGKRSWSKKTDEQKRKEIDALTPAQGKRYAKAPASLDHEQAMWHAKRPNGGTPRPLVENAKGRLMPEKKSHASTLKAPTDGNGKPLSIAQKSEFGALDKNSKNAYLGMANNRMRAYTHAEMMSNVTQPHTKDGFHQITEAERQELRGPRGNDGKPVKGPDGKSLQNSVTGVSVPPGWAKVLINDHWRDPKQGQIIAGFAANGKVQPQYSLAHHQRKAVEKFQRVMSMGKAMPTLDRALAQDVGNGNSAADVLSIVRASGMRPDRGSGSGSQKAYGATSLEARHIVSIKGNVTHFKFQAKDGVLMDFKLDNPQVSSMLRGRLQTRRGTTPLFDPVSSDAKSPKSMEHYMRTVGGMDANIKVKDLRTYIGTSLAHAEAKRMVRAKLIGPDSTAAEKAAAKQHIAEHVGARLGNKPAQAQKSYIDQGVYMLFETGAKL